jgi:hypothetical protein
MKKPYYYIFYHPVYSCAPTFWLEGERPRFPKVFIHLEKAIDRIEELYNEHPENTYYLYECLPIHCTDNSIEVK